MLLTGTRSTPDTFVDLLHHQSSSNPHRIAYKFLKHGGDKQSSTVTYQEIAQQAQAIAAELQQHHPAGSRALLLYQPGINYVAAFLGCLYAGIVAVPAYPPRRNQSAIRLRAIVNDACASVALTTAAVLESVQGALTSNTDLAQLRWLATDTLPSDLATEWSPTSIAGDTLAFLQYTSGSTGDPKGVMVSHANLLHNSATIHQCFGHSTDSQGVIWLPPYHDMGLIGGILQPLYGGFPVTLMSPVDFLQRPLRWLQAISTERATTSGGPNFAYDLCLQKITPEQKESLDLSSWNVAFTGAEPIRARTIERFSAEFSACGFRREAFYPCYGMAEATLIVTGGLVNEPPTTYIVDGDTLNQNQVTSFHPDARPANSRQLVGCGTACRDTTIRIVEPGSRVQCPPQQVGEIWLSSPSVARGYWNQSEKTQATFNAFVANTGEGPFLRTGDLGFIQDGELVVTGRIKDMTIIKGRNYYPQDLELTVENSHPAIRPGCGAAFAVDLDGSERLVIVYEVKRSYLRKLNVNEIVGCIRQAIAAEHSLQVYATVLVKTGSIPKTSSGKIRRFACRDRFLSGQLNVVNDWCKSPQGRFDFIKLKADIEFTLHNLRENLNHNKNVKKIFK
ncbi:MAG: fatty acyl-AMP ligase [Synechococcus sp.]